DARMTAEFHAFGGANLATQLSFNDRGRHENVCMNFAAFADDQRSRLRVQLTTDATINSERACELELRSCTESIDRLEGRWQSLVPGFVMRLGLGQKIRKCVSKRAVGELPSNGFLSKHFVPPRSIDAYWSPF